MRKAILVLSCMLVLAPPAAYAQDEQTAGSGSGSGSRSGQAASTSQSKAALEEQMQAVEKALAVKKANEQNPRFVRTLTNVQVELTLTDQVGTQAPEKKTVSMIVSSGNWGKIRSVGNVRPQNDAPFVVDLNVDARPLVSVEGPIQLELTLVYSPQGGPTRTP